MDKKGESMVKRLRKLTAREEKYRMMAADLAVTIRKLQNEINEHFDEGDTSAHR